MRANRIETTGDFSSKREKEKFDTLRKAGMMLQGIYDKNGERTRITISDPTSGSRTEIAVTAIIRQFEGQTYTAYVPSRRDMASVRRSIVAS